MFPEDRQLMKEHCFRKKSHLGNKVYDYWVCRKTFFLPGKQMLFPQQCIEKWENTGTFVQTLHVIAFEDRSGIVYPDSR